MQVLPSELKRGTVILLENTPHVVEEMYVTGTAQTRHKLHTKLRNLKTGRFVERVFTDNDRVQTVEVDYRMVQYSYKQGDNYVFLDTETYDEVTLTADQIGERRFFLIENQEYRAIFLEGKLLDIVLPPSMVLEVVDTAPAIKGGSDSTWKPAKLETGLEIMVPLFIEKGEKVRVDTETKKYLGKESPKGK